MQEIINGGRKKADEIRNILVEFLNKCGIEYPRDVQVDAAFDEDCHVESIRRGYDMDILSPFLRVGIDIAGSCYLHLEDKRIPRYIAIYTAFLTFLDDICQTEEGMTLISSFMRRFMNNKSQEHKMLDDLADVLREANEYWRPITATIIISTSLRYITSLFLDSETKGMQISGKAIHYATFSRMLSGSSETYSVFAFPPEMPTCYYIQAMPNMMDSTNHINDILSFYKEELQGEDLNYISLVGKSHSLGKIDALKMIADNTANAHLRALDLLKVGPSAKAMLESGKWLLVPDEDTVSKFRQEPRFATTGRRPGFPKIDKTQFEYRLIPIDDFKTSISRRGDPQDPASAIVYQYPFSDLPKLVSHVRPEYVIAATGYKMIDARIEDPVMYNARSNYEILRGIAFIYHRWVAPLISEVHEEPTYSPPVGIATSDPSTGTQVGRMFKVNEDYTSPESDDSDSDDDDSDYDDDSDASLCSDDVRRLKLDLRPIRATPERRLRLKNGKVC